MSTGLKLDTGKLPLGLLDVKVMKEIAKVLQFGANKYARENWRGGISYTRVYEATLRHLFAWYDGEKLDEETKLNHLAHAMCELMFLLNYELEGRNELDDRYVANKVSMQ